MATRALTLRVRLLGQNLKKRYSKNKNWGAKKIVKRTVRYILSVCVTNTVCSNRISRKQCIWTLINIGTVDSREHLDWRGWWRSCLASGSTCTIGSSQNVSSHYPVARETTVRWPLEETVPTLVDSLGMTWEYLQTVKIKNLFRWREKQTKETSWSSEPVNLCSE